MKKIFYASRYLLLAGFLFLYSCKKNVHDVQVYDPVKTELAAKVTAWLDKEQSITGVSANKTKIQNFKESLNFSKLWIEDLNDGERFVVLPVNEQFQSKNNQDKKPVNYGLFILDKKGIVRKGNIVQYIPALGNTAVALPVNTFNKMYNFRKLEADGMFSFLNIADQLLYQYGYKNGELSSYGVLQKSPLETVLKKAA